MTLTHAASVSQRAATATATATDAAAAGYAASAAVRWVRRLALAGLLIAFTVVVLGAYVRLTAAGLGCPDWPGCYGHVSPLGLEPGAALDLGKAWREMIHRYAATTLGVVIVVIAALALVSRRERGVPLGLALALLGLVVVQGMLGMLTVTLLLKPLIVTGHLVFGLSTLALLAWLWLSLRGQRTTPGAARALGPQSPALPTAQRLALLALIVLALQIALGGWTSSNYAAVACPDLPKCQNQWVPEMSYRDGFALWRGVGNRDAGSGSLGAARSRVAIHFTHRLGAVLTTLTLLLAAGGTWAAALRAPPPERTRWRAAQGAALAVVGALALQIGIATRMVLQGFPLGWATAHAAGAALLLLSVVTLNRALRPVGSGTPRPADGSNRGDSANLRLPSPAPTPNPSSVT
jgi:cytochrome c oxidase assembly protein subunit 15